MSVDSSKTTSLNAGPLASKPAVLIVESYLIYVKEISESQQLLYCKYPKSRIQVPGYLYYYKFLEYTRRPNTYFDPNTVQDAYVKCCFMPLYAVKQTVLSA